MGRFGLVASCSGRGVMYAMGNRIYEKWDPIRYAIFDPSFAITRMRRPAEGQDAAMLQSKIYFMTLFRSLYRWLKCMNGAAKKREDS